MLDFRRIPEQPDPGHYFDEEYVEWYWLAVLGPTGFCTLRRIHQMTDGLVGKWEIERDDFADLVHVSGPRLGHTLRRLDHYGLIHHRGHSLWEVPIGVRDLTQGEIDTELPATLAERIDPQ